MILTENVKRWNGLPLLIFGTSGISKEVKTVVDEINLTSHENVFNFLGFVSEKSNEIGNVVLGSKVVCSDDNFGECIKDYSQVGVVIPLGTPATKRQIVQKISQYPNLVYPNIISPSAKFMNDATIEMGIGNVICSGCILTTDIHMGNFNLININSTIGHDVCLGNYGVINPLSSISGNVTVEDEVLLGAGCSIKQGVTIKERSIVGLGAIIVKDAAEGSTMICKAAERIK